MQVLRKSFGRVFIKTQSGVYQFVNSMGVGTLDRSLGEVSPIEIPSELDYDKFEEIASVNGADSRWTSSITSILPRDFYSPLELLANNKQEFSMQIHYGECSKPNNFSAFDSAIVLNKVKLTNYSLTELIARSPDQRGIVEESANISAASMYRILPQKFVKSGQGNMTSMILSNPVYIKESACINIKSANCAVFVAAYVNNAGTRGFVYTTDGGLTWTAQNVPGFTIDNNSIDASRFYLYFDGSDLIVLMEAKVSGVNKTLIYRMPVNMLGQFAATATSVINMNSIAMRGADIGSRYIFLAAGSAKAEIWVFDLSRNTLTKLYEDAVVPGFMSNISVLDDDNVVAFNSGNRFIISNTYGLFTSGIVNSNSTFPYSSEFLSDGTLVLSAQDGIHLSHDNGNSWILSAVLPSSAISDMKFYDSLTGYVFNSTGVHRTIDGGYTWTKVYDLPSTSLGLNRRMTICPNNPNMFVGVSGQTTVGNNQTAAIVGK